MNTALLLDARVYFDRPPVFYFTVFNYRFPVMIVIKTNFWHFIYVF